jgi:hypothetical protein
MSKMNRSITELTEQEIKTLIAAAVTKGIFEAQSKIERTKNPNREIERLAVLEVDRAVYRIGEFVNANNLSPIVELSDIKALIEIEIRKLSSAALAYLAGDRFVHLVGRSMELKRNAVISKDRHRRVVYLCRTFAQALAYYRVQSRPEFESLFKPAEAGEAGIKFWRAVNGALFDSCVLDWCKLFGDEKAHHHWSRIVADPTAFEAELLMQLGLDSGRFDLEIEAMREYRDKWVAHLDSKPSVTLPRFDIAKRAVWFYHAHVVNEAKLSDPASDLALLPADLEPEYQETEEDAKTVYRRFINSRV